MERRAFLSAGTAALAAAAWPGRLMADALSRLPSTVGIQLYTVRRLMSTDADGTLAALAGIGYREVELAGLYGRTAGDFRKLLDKHGLHAPATHISLSALRNNTAQVLDDAAILGNHWVIVPSLDAAERTIDGIRRVADALNQAGAKAKERGMRVGYHNHQYEFAAINGTVPYDILLSQTDRNLVDFELDLFWIRRGGGDTLAYFAKNPGRFVALHVKDMTADGKMVNVGAGAIDFAGIFAHADRAGVMHYFVEHDEPTDPIADARTSFVATQKLLRVE
jgi:sugar phosphate isomerase/epimerase